MPEKIKKELHEFKLFINSLPSAVSALLIMAVFSMNLLANKSISLPFSFMALDCGIVISWLVFLIMDVVTRHFGPKCATELSVFAVLINLFFSLFFFAVSVIPGVWSAASPRFLEEVIGSALDKTVGGTWYIVLGSAFAFLIAATVNNFTNHGIGKLFKKNPDGAFAYFLRAYASTAVGQFVDNLTFSLTVSRVFFGWTLTQCFVCALTGMLAELVCEVLFWRLGFKICAKWKKDGVGKEYFDFLNSDKAAPEQGKDLE